MKKTINDFTLVKEQLKRIVADRSEMITELYEKVPYEQDVLNNITLNLKIKTENKLAPLKISFLPINKG
jgi:hypothetical protein